MGFLKKIRTGSGSGSDFIKKNLKPDPKPDPDKTRLYIYTVLLNYPHIYIVKNPKLFYTLLISNFQLTVTPPPLPLHLSALSHTQPQEAHNTLGVTATSRLSALPLSSSSRRRRTTCTGFTHAAAAQALYSLNSVSSSPSPISHCRTDGTVLYLSHLPRPWPQA